MDRFIRRQILIIRVRSRDRTVFYTNCTTRAYILYDVSGFFYKGYPEVSRLPINAVNLRIGKDLYVRMPADLDQFWRKNSHGALIGGKGLVKLGHMAADGR